MLAIIGGSGFYYLGRDIEKIDVITPFGHATVHKAKLHNDEEILFVPRHGDDHSIPPHRVNYRANIYAIRKLGATTAFATYAAGILNDYKVGDLIMLEDFIGLFIQQQSFFNDLPIRSPQPKGSGFMTEGQSCVNSALLHKLKTSGFRAELTHDFSSGMKHTNMNEPFDKELQKAIIEIAAVDKIKIKKNGVIVTTPGPRFESKAEIAFLKKTGANLVNMTSAYEIALMRELEMPFAALAIATNYGAGLSKKAPSAEEVLEQTNKARDKINVILNQLVDFVE